MQAATHIPKSHQETPGRFALPWHWLPLPPSKTKRPQAGEVLKHVKRKTTLPSQRS